MLTSRRNFLGLLAAPAIVRASSLMKVAPLPEVDWTTGVALRWGDKTVWTISIPEERVAEIRALFAAEIASAERGVFRNLLAATP